MVPCCPTLDFVTASKRWKSLFNYCGSIRTPGIMIWRNLHFCYFRKLHKAFLALWFFKRRFLNDPTLFLHFGNYFQFEKQLAFDLNNFEFPLPEDDLYKVSLILVYLFWKEFLFHFYSFAIISRQRKGFPFIWTILNPLYVTMICANFGYNWSNISGEDVKFWQTGGQTSDVR